ncbi:MAG: NAD-dependent epimerase/dehydratase family protein [Candidatus Babeliales bacterium]|nr:NAD-dependent epimerase/dehydratase family protein [Candidatus Babeliales bacterium]
MYIIKKAITFLSLFFCFNIFCQTPKADLLAFSYDRPIQLYAFLESGEKYITGLNEINIIYRTSSQEIEAAYAIVKERFKKTNFYKEENNFKELVIKHAFASPSDYIIFGVDDIFVKDYVNLHDCINALQSANAYGFYLRLGKNITQCYMHNDEITPVPKSTQIDENIFQWSFNTGIGDWKYPNTVDMTLYKKEDIKNNILNIDFKNPSDLEAHWAACSDYNLTGLYFKESKIVNTPLNIVHTEKLNEDNRHSAIFSTKDLLNIFTKGSKIDINVYHKINNIAPHAAIVPKFINRNLMNSTYKNKNVLVTGGAGFIGSHLTEKLVELGAQVTVLDNLCTGNLVNLINVKDKIKFINGDIENLEDCLNATQNAEIIFHLAAFISVPGSMANPQACMKTNVDGTFNLLEACKINNVKRFVLSSSSAVYGQKQGICKETDACKPTSVYGYSKLLNEEYCKMYSNLFNLNTVCLRYFNVYGERQNPNAQYAAVVAKFTDNMQRNLPLEIYGTGEQTRDFVHVSKIVEANLMLAMLPESQMTGQAFNIATGTSINLLQLIEQLKIKFPNYTGEILFKPARSGDVEHTAADCTQLNKAIHNNL